MKLCRFRLSQSADAGVRTGILAADRVEEATGEWPGPWSRTGRSWPLGQVRLLAPVVPSKIICVARNYQKHAAELGNPVPKEPLIFLKAPSSAIGPGDTIEMPSDSARVDYEGELAVVIGRECSRLGPDDAIEPYLAGFTCLNDVTARDIQKREGHFGRAKSFDTFCPLGPVIETELDWRRARVETFVNGEKRQSGTTTEMIFPLDELVRWVSRIMTLVPGDIIATGTPEGIAALKAGDVVEVSIEGIGRLSNPVATRRKR
jgi:2-keto-4-pentenoate hydratase/2-oxohepta-3-ene-1,7-dioic acid hydratase in catechol pathway